MRFNKTNMKKLRDAIEKEIWHLNMKEVLSNMYYKKTAKSVTVTSCKTAGCIAGHCLLIKAKENKTRVIKREEWSAYTSMGRNWEVIARKWLRLPEQDAECFFFPYDIGTLSERHSEAHVRKAVLMLIDDILCGSVERIHFNWLRDYLIKTASTQTPYVGLW